jgi:hypothetical protein
MVEGLAAIGLIGSIVQFVSFAYALVSKSREIHQYASGVSADLTDRSYCEVLRRCYLGTSRCDIGYSAKQSNICDGTTKIVKLSESTGVYLEEGARRGIEVQVDST